MSAPAVGQVIAGKYRIISRLGSGGMGLVYLAERVGVGSRVALKFLDPAPSEDETRIARFLREAKVGLEVQHPGAAQILDLGRDESMRLFLCFELAEGEDLREIIKREGRLRAGESIDIALQVAQVLAFAHDRHIVHRDVKPENVRVRRDLAGPHVKVLDFGIARLLKDAGVRLTAEGMLAGTPRYMAPEQVKDEPLTGAVDQYALGLMLFEMLTGAVAMGGKNVSQILLHQMQTLVPPLAWVDPQLSHPELDAFIARACAKQPLDRFPSMAAFITALQAVPVDVRAWPAARPPPSEAASSTALTRDGKVPPPPFPGAPVDPLWRKPERAEYEPRVEVATEPGGHQAVAPRAAHAVTEQRTEPERPAPALPLLLTESKIVEPPPHLELPTDPERPAVSRRAPALPSRPERPAVNQTVRGLAVPVKPRASLAPIWWGLAFAVLAATAAWWFTQH